MAAPVGPKKVKRYSNEFKIQAVKLSSHPDIQTQDVAHALDIHPFMLSKWKRDYREGRLKPAERIHGDSGGRYGSPRVHEVLRREGIRSSNKRVARLMRERGLRGRVS